MAIGWSGGSHGRPIGKAAANVACGARRGLAHTLPEKLFCPVFNGQLARLVVGDEAGNEVKG